MLAHSPWHLNYLFLYLISKIDSQWNLKLMLLRLIEISTLLSIILLQVEQLFYLY